MCPKRAVLGSTTTVAALVQELRFKRGVPQDIYVVGAANVGKSSIINRLVSRMHALPRGKRPEHVQTRDKKAAKSKGPRKPRAIVLDVLPSGYVVPSHLGGVTDRRRRLTACRRRRYQEGDVFTGDWNELETMAHKQQTGILPEKDEAGATAQPTLSQDAVSSAIALDSSSAVAGAAGVAGALHAAAAAAGAQSGNDSGGSGKGATVAAAKPELSVSPLPGTTLDVVRTSLPGGGCLADTPGIVVNEDAYRLWESLGEEGGARAVKEARPLRKIKVGTGRNCVCVLRLWRCLTRPCHACVYVTQPTIFRLRPGRSMFLGGLARIDYAHSDPNVGILLTWFGALHPHLTRTERK